MTNEQLLEYSLESNWLGLFKKVYRKVNYSIEHILFNCVYYNFYIFVEYILNNHKIDWNKWSDWTHNPHYYNNKEIVLLLIKHGFDIDKEIKYCKKNHITERLKFCLEIKKELTKCSKNEKVKKRSKK